MPRRKYDTDTIEDNIICTSNESDEYKDYINEHEYFHNMYLEKLDNARIAFISILSKQEYSIDRKLYSPTLRLRPEDLDTFIQHLAKYRVETY
jgi:hypothetical protein